MTAHEDHSRQAIARHTEWADTYQSLYDDARDNPYRDVFRYGRHLMDMALDAHVPADGTGKRALDVGCGTGHHLAELRRRGFEGAGIDGSEEMLRHARENNPGADIRAASVDDLPFEDASFDLVLSIEVLRHLHDGEPAIQEMSRVLKPGGFALVTAAPRYSLNLYPVVNQLTSRVQVRDLRRLKQFFTTSRRLRTQFRAAGFSDVEVQGVGLGPWSWIERLAPGRTPSLLRRWERHDRALADQPVLRDLTNMYLVRAVR